MPLLHLFPQPGMSLCPTTLADCGTLANYYNQQLLEAVMVRGLSFPNAFYIDEVVANGLIRTGTQRNGTSLRDPHTTTGYAYADTLALYSLKQACHHAPAAACAPLQEMLEARRALNPLQLWSDIPTGRLLDWPVFPLTHTV